jgi:hypothetical protein
MLYMPVPVRASEHYFIALCVLAYLGILFLVLKTFQYNKDKFEN